MGVNEPHQGLRFDGHGLREVRVGGSEQWIHVRGADPRNPVVLFLHGGPGTSQLTANARNTRALEDAFMLVDWDQRGAGKSYAAGLLPGSMTIEQFVADTLELTQQLLGWFDQPRLVLVGHSWAARSAPWRSPRVRTCSRVMSASDRSAA